MNRTELKMIRRRLGLTQLDLAARLGVHPMTVSRWERSAHRVPAMAATLIRQMLQASRAARPRRWSR